MWQLCSRDFPRGNIGKLSNDKIASALEWEDDPNALVHALEMSGFIDPHPVHRYVVHDWPHHCEDSIHSYLARRFERFADGSVPKFTRLTTLEKKAVIEKWEKIISGDHVELQKQGSLFVENNDENTSVYFQHTSTEVQTLPLPLPFATATAKETLSPLPVAPIPEKPRESPPLAFKIPEVLDTKDFRETLERWKRYRAVKKNPLTEPDIEQLYLDLAPYGHYNAKLAISEAMTGGMLRPLIPKKKPERPPTTPREPSELAKSRAAEAARKISEVQNRGKSP